MVNKTTKLEIDKNIIRVVKQLQDAGFETYIVGGAVRDALIGRKPKDYDISTAATPEEVRSVFGRKWARIIGRRFRLVHLRCGKEIVEISTFRKKPSAKNKGDKRVEKILSKKKNVKLDNLILRDNEFGSSNEDAWRRDFSINALFYDPVSEQLIDNVGCGLEDIENKIIRVIGVPKVRFEEDPVRLLRALKFAGQCGFSIDSQTEEALKENLQLITHAAPSRLTLELEKILSNSYSHEILKTFHKYGLLHYFLPFFETKFDTVAGQYALKLLTERNRRVNEGYYRNSVSLAVSCLMLPFVEDELGNGEPGTLWRNFESIEPIMKRMLKKSFSPHCLIKRVIGSALRTLQYQPKLRFDNITNNMRYVKSYAHARELAIIQDNVLELEKDYENILPRAKRRSNTKFSKKVSREKRKGHHKDSDDSKCENHSKGDHRKKEHHGKKNDEIKKRKHSKPKDKYKDKKKYRDEDILKLGF